jgi:hypothetical protein
MFQTDLAPPEQKSENHSERRQKPTVIKRAKVPAGISWSLVNFVLDGILFVAFVLLCWIASVTQWLFPPGATGENWTLLGAKVEVWRQFQFGVTCFLAAAILIHVMLHWSWVCGVFETRILSQFTCKRSPSNDGARTLVGVILLATTILLSGLALGIAASIMQRIE